MAWLPGPLASTQINTIIIGESRARSTAGGVVLRALVLSVTSLCWRWVVAIGWLAVRGGCGRCSVAWPPRGLCRGRLMVVMVR